MRRVVVLTSLESRDAKGADTHEIQSNISGVKRVYFRKYGDEFTMWLAGEDGIMRMADRKSTRLNSGHLGISYAVFCFQKNMQGALPPYLLSSGVTACCGITCFGLA